MPNPSAPLDVTRVRELVAATHFADVRYRATTASTNTDAAALLGDAAARGVTIVAEYQTAGSGRKGRRWFAPPGAALLFTTIVPRAIATCAVWAIPFWTSLAVADALDRWAHGAIDLVWPNDLHVRGGKLGGILSVARVAGEAADVATGVGLNVHRPAGDPDLDALDVPARFADELAPAIRREDLLAAVLHAFERRLPLLDEPDAVARAWEERAQLAGTRYRYRRDGDGVERDGIALGLGALGTLRLHVDGSEVSVDMADVRVVGRERDASPADEQSRLH